MSRRACAVAVLVAAAILVVPEPALAYGGPGSIISGIGALLAVVGAIAASIFGFVWFPLKRLIRKLGAGEDEAGLPGTGAAEDATAK